jgi:hypothetical protein
LLSLYFIHSSSNQSPEPIEVGFEVFTGKSGFILPYALDKEKRKVIKGK